MAKPNNKLNICKTIINIKGNTYYIADLGIDKSQRFALYLEDDSKPLKKSNNPFDFDKYIYEE